MSSYILVRHISSARVTVICVDQARKPDMLSVIKFPRETPSKYWTLILVLRPGNVPLGVCPGGDSGVEPD